MWVLMSRGGVGGGGAGNLTMFVPGDGQGFVSMRAAEMWRAPGFRDGFFRGAQMQPGAPDPVSMLQQNYGLTPEEVERATVVVQDSQANVVWFVVETVAAADQAKIQAKIQNPTTTAHQGKSYVAGGVPGAIGRVGIHFAGPRLVVMGPEEGVRRALDVAAKRTAGPLDEGLALLGGGKHLVAGFNVPPASTAQMQQQMRGNPFLAQYAALAEVQGGTMTMAIGQNLDIEASLKFPGDAQAQAAKGMVDKAVPGLKGMMALAKVQAPPGQQQQEMDAIAKGLDTLKAVQNGPRLVLTFQAQGVMVGR